MTKLAVALLVLWPVVFFRQVLINPKRYIPYDLHGFHTPLADYIAWSLREGRFPAWDPNPYCGYPIHADIQAQLFYPPAWLAILARNLTAPGTMLYWLQLEIVLHMALAGILTFAFARRLGAGVPAALLAGTVYQLGAFFASQAQHLGAICGAAWLPLAWMAIEALGWRWSARWFAALTAALALGFLAGFTAFTLVMWSSTLLLALVVNWRTAWRVPCAMAATLPLIAAQLIPTWRWVPYTAASLRPDWNTGQGTPLRSWISFLWPDWHHAFEPDLFKDEGNFTFFYAYCGVAAIVGLALALRRAPRWVALAAVFGTLQAGTHLPGWEIVYPHLPRAVKGAVYANFFFAAACLAIALATGLAWQRLPPRLAWAMAILTAIELIAVGANRPMNTYPGSWRWITSELRVNGNRDLVTALERYTRAETPPLRVDALDLNYSFTMNASLRRIPSANGDNPLAPLRLLELRRQFAKGEWWERQYPVQNVASPLLDYLNVGYLIGETARENPDDLQRAQWCPREGGAWMRFYRNEEVQPRYFLVGAVRGTGRTNAVQVGQLDLRREAVVEGPAPAVASAGEVRVEHHEPDRIQLSTESNGASFLVTSDSHHPDWRVTVDGRAAEVRLTNHAFLGVAVPAGRHRVEFRYEPWGLTPLVWLWGLSWAALAGWGILPRRAALVE